MHALVDYNMSKTSECLNGAATLRKNEFPLQLKKKKESLSFRFTAKKKRAQSGGKGKKEGEK